jgi:hypothetical protein
MKAKDQNLLLLAALAALAVWYVNRNKTTPTPLLPSATVPSYYPGDTMGDVYL